MYRAMAYDGVLVRFLTGQLDGQGMPPGAQKKFDHGMDTLALKGKAVWSNPVVNRSMGAKDSLVKIKDLKVGLPVRKALALSLSLSLVACFDSSNLSTSRARSHHSFLGTAFFHACTSLFLILTSFF